MTDGLQTDTSHYTTYTTSSAVKPTPSLEPIVLVTRPPGWMYKSIRIGRFNLPWYASPQVQLVLVAFVCFLCVGMYNALSGLGGGGLSLATPQDNANTALYSTFSVVGFFAGTFSNRLGIRLTLSLGGLGYCIYASSYLCYSHTQNLGFVVFSGALLGVCAGLLWTAQGAIMMSYPPENSKGKYISWFWSIFNLGAVIGALIPLGLNVKDTADSTVSDATYIGFITLMFLGAISALLLCDADKVLRADGSHVILMKNPTWQSEIWGLWTTLKDNSYILLLFPMFFASNFFYTYQFNGINKEHFNTRTRALNNILYWLAQIAGAFMAGYALDISSIRRVVRARAALVGLLILTLAIWGGGLAFQASSPDRKITASPDYHGRLDWSSKGYAGPMILYVSYGFFDAVWQLCVYWFMGALSNSGRKTANFAGFYKGIQSAGAAIIWRIDAMEKPFMTEFATTWGLLAGALLFASPVIFYKIKDVTSLDDDLKFTDLNYADVIPQGYLEEDTTHHQGPGRGSLAQSRHPYTMENDVELPSMRQEKRSEDV